MDQISGSGTGGSLAAKLGMPVILMPFRIPQNSACGSMSPTTSLRSGGPGLSPSENLDQSTPGPPWQCTQPRSEKLLAPARTSAASLSDTVGLSVAWRAIEAERTCSSTQLTGSGSGWFAA